MRSSIETFCPFKAFWLLCMCLRAVATEIEVFNGTSDYAAILRELPANFGSHELGCADRSGPVDAYVWRRVGFGSNVNMMILPWLNAILHGRKDLALVMGNHYDQSGGPDEYFEVVNCLETSNAAVADGFSCLFQPMPHVCVFHTRQDWNSFMIERNVPTAERENALKHIGVADHEAKISDIDQQLQGSGIDTLAAKAALLDYFYLNWQPWVKRDIQIILDERTVATVRDGPYVGLHVQRGDNITREAKAHDVQEYLKKAYLYIKNSAEATVSVNDMRGIWVSSDDKQVVSHVKESFAEFFPEVELERIVWISDRASESTNASSSDPFQTKAELMHYESYVAFFAELKMLSQADIFVGTFPSNVAPIIVLLRESRGIARSSSLSVDRQDWFPEPRFLDPK